MLLAYRFLTSILYPILIFIIYIRVFLKKELVRRYKEKISIDHFNIKRDFKKKLIWFHVASIGELQSILPLINKITKTSQNIEVLVTTVTISSANLLKKKLIELQNTIHRFLPLDLNFLSKAFVEKWRPDLVCFVDSEIWPNFLINIKEKKIPLILLNGRITKKTFKRWNRIPKFAKEIFNTFDLCLASSKESENNLKLLNANNIKLIGNLKFTYEVNNQINLNHDIENKFLKNFNTWCAASTHEGEEEIIIKTHLLLEKKIQSLKTIIIPRHIDRCTSIKNICEKFNLICQILNENELINPNSNIVIVNSYGVLQKYYKICKIVFVGKSLMPKLKNVGGQNPIEPAKHGCKILHGPFVYNFQEIYKQLASHSISEQINNEIELAEKIENNLNMTHEYSDKIIISLNEYGNKILEETLKKINHYIK
jgi:3-deoxy-D-manno-octulosonic-acid transferase